MDKYLTELPHSHKTEKAPEELCYSEDGDNIGSQPEAMPDNLIKVELYAREVSYKNVEFDKEGINKSTSG